jgi:nicotinamidase-related amidase
MATGSTLALNLRRSVLGHDEWGRSIWQEQVTPRVVAAAQVAIIICDMWDNHWSRGAAERVDAMAPHMNRVVQAARTQGVQIVHAPSETMEFYADTPARRRILACVAVEPPAAREHSDPPLPIDDSDGGSDTGEAPWHQAWSRQHPALEIDQELDVISDDGREIYSLLQWREIEQVLIMGVHTNMCVLKRSFAIKQMIRWNVDVALVRDLTDAMYNPARPPYVSHDQGTQLVIGYIEKFCCPSLTSSDIEGTR